ncbi:MAG: tripartite tricarboxylate transporter substrate binding protein [Peptococcaceae bacterium]
MQKLRNFMLMSAAVMLMLGLLLAGCGEQKAEQQTPGGNETQEQGKEEAGYPERNIEAVVGWGAGGGTDTFTRSIAIPTADILGTNVVVVNKPGASGSIGGDYVARQPADGYTIWAISSNYPLNVALGKTPHGLDSYIPVARLQYDTGTIQLAAGGPYRDINELLAAVKENPGEIAIGGTGAKGFDEIVISMWEKAAGIDLNYVPYDDAGKMHSALLGGHISAMFEEFGPTIGLIKDGKIKVALAFTEERLDQFPDVPVAPELGWNVTEGQSRGILVPAGTSPEIVKILQDTFQEAKKSESYRKYEADKLLNLREGWLDSRDYQAHLEEAIKNYEVILDEIQG